MAAPCRRPIEEWEKPYLAAMGAILRQHRNTAHLSYRALSERTFISVRHLQRVERGQRRTRSRTLYVIARAIAAARLHDGTADDHLLPMTERIRQELVSAAGPALAPPSEYEDRVARRRVRRIRRKLSEAAKAERRALEARAKAEREFADRIMGRLDGL